MRGADAPTLLEAAQKGDNDACERLLVENRGLIWSVAKRYYGRGVESEDLYQLGCLGFLKAVRGFDLNYGTQFSTYAVPKIAGEIRRFLRDDGPVKVSRGLKERSAAVRGAQSRLSARLGREPTLSELSAETGLEPEDIAAADYRSVSGVNCIYVETVQDSEGYSQRYWVSVETGLLVASERLLEGETIYRMASLTADLSTPSADRFILPDGTVLLDT